uniref:Uncharacterized protein n=1 Tax=Arundo donax TaxID=35708 RepID=A0A0A9AY62_ARUDO
MARSRLVSASWRRRCRVLPWSRFSRDCARSGSSRL